MMRRDGDWMTIEDERILEYLNIHHLATPNELASVLDDPKGIIRERLRCLSMSSFVVPLTDDLEYFELGRRGAAYLEGRVRADLICPPPDPRRNSLVLG